jgi:hypothetical protein
MPKAKKIVITPEEAKQIEEVTVPRETVVAELGEKAVAKIEKEAEPVEVVVAPVVKTEEPAVVTGNFYTLKRGDKFVVVNRLGQIVSKPLDESKAIEMVARFQGLTR